MECVACWLIDSKKAAAKYIYQGKSLCQRHLTMARNHEDGKIW